MDNMLKRNNWCRPVFRVSLTFETSQKDVFMKVRRIVKSFSRFVGGTMLWLVEIKLFEVTVFGEWGQQLSKLSESIFEQTKHKS